MIIQHAAAECTTWLCSFYDRDAPIYTMSRFLPPSKVQGSEVNNSILGDGCVVRYSPCANAALGASLQILLSKESVHIILMQNEFPHALTEQGL